MKVGISSFALRYAIAASRHPLDPIGVLEKAAALGAEVVQICDNLPLAPLSNHALDALARRAGDLGLELEVGTRGSGPAQLDRYFEITQRLGARILRVVLSDAEEGRTLEEERATLQALLPRLAEARITLALENRFRLAPGQMAEFIRSLEAPNAGACLDPLNSISRLIGPQEAIRALAPLAVTAHVKSGTMRREGAIWVLRGCPVGEGLLDVEALVAAVQSNGRTPPPNLLAEGWMEPLESEAATLAQEEEWTRRGIAYLKRLVRAEDGGPFGRLRAG
jgi:sugar phosphate isomerase/epimerase